MRMLLTITIAVPIVCAIVTVIRHGGEYFYIYVWALLFAVSVFLLTIYPEYIAPVFNQYARLSEDSDEFKKITLLAKRVHFPLTDIYVMDGSKRSAHSNAFFYGFFNNKRIVLYDTLMEQVDMDELLAILGHEIGHWSLGHTLQGFAITQVWIFLMFFGFAQFGGITGFVADFGFSPHDTPVLIRLLLFMQVFFEPVDKTLTFFMNMLSRRNEFAADAYAKGLGMGRELSTGLLKISKENLSNMVPDKLYSAYHFSHPPVVERLAELKPFTVQGVVMEGDSLTPTKGNVARDKEFDNPAGRRRWLTWIRTSKELDEVQLEGIWHTCLLFVAAYLNYVFSTPYMWLIKLYGWAILFAQSFIMTRQLWIAVDTQAARNKSKSE
jgi:Zn-dependent protease with chaperone function